MTAINIRYNFYFLDTLVIRLQGWIAKRVTHVFTCIYDERGAILKMKAKGGKIHAKDDNSGNL